MSVIVTDAGFAPAPERQVVALAVLTAEATAVDLAHTDDPSVLESALDRLTLIRVAFPAFNDGRAFTVGRKLRMMGYKGQLLALGPVIADQEIEPAAHDEADVELAELEVEVGIVLERGAVHLGHEAGGATSGLA